MIYCGRCGEEISRVHHTTAEALGHDWDSGRGTRVATTTAEGVILYTCRRDHTHTRTEKIAKIPQKKTKVNTTPTGLGASFYPVSKKQTKNSIRVVWAGIPGATGYAVYGAPAGKGQTLQLLTEQAGTVFDWRGLKKKTYYQVVVVAYNSRGVVAESQAVYAATKGGKYTNARKLKVKKKLKLKKGKSKKLKVTQVKQSKKGKIKKYRKVCFVSSNPAVAAVNGKGKVKAEGKGTCLIYIYAQNGVSTKVKVTVK